MKYFVVTIQNNKKQIVHKIFNIKTYNKQLELIPDYNNRYTENIEIFYYKGEYLNTTEELVDLLKNSEYRDYSFEYISKKEKDELLKELKKI